MAHAQPTRQQKITFGEMRAAALATLTADMWSHYASAGRSTRVGDSIRHGTRAGNHRHRGMTTNSPPRAPRRSPRHHMSIGRKMPSRETKRQRRAEEDFSSEILLKRREQGNTPDKCRKNELALTPDDACAHRCYEGVEPSRRAGVRVAQRSPLGTPQAGARSVTHLRRSKAVPM
jgi:hypothetical protein